MLVVCTDRCSDDQLYDSSSQYLAAFIVAMVFQGFGIVPLYVLGVPYIDDASPPGTASVHIGICNNYYQPLGGPPTQKLTFIHSFIHIRLLVCMTHRNKLVTNSNDLASLLLRYFIII